MSPRMILIAGPPGSGKSSAFPVSGFGVDFFNADDRAAALNGNSYQGISQDIRRVVNREFEEFILGHIQRRESFAIETTLRSHVTFEQANLARAQGFRVEMRYLALHHFALHFNRVKAAHSPAGTAPRKERSGGSTTRVSPICGTRSRAWTGSGSTTTARWAANPGCA